MSVQINLFALATILLCIPSAYFVFSYCYLISWHRKSSLWDVIVHENGRLTLLGSLFHFDHFVACIPMVNFFALCAAGGFALGSNVPSTEIATYPLTGIPIALVSLLITEAYLGGGETVTVGPGTVSVLLIGLGVTIMMGQLLLLRNVDISTMAQKPSFAANGLSTPYLMCSHVFEHFLDFVLIGPLAAGIYALLRFLSL
jgi:hypothetical protein